MSIQLETDVLSIRLPAGWTDESDDEGLSFSNSETLEELSISLGEITQRVDAAKLAEIVWRLIQHKAGALGQMSQGAFTVIDAVESTPSFPSIGSFSGFDSTHGVYSKVVITGQHSHFISLSYYRKGCTAPSAEVAARADTVLALCVAKAA